MEELLTQEDLGGPTGPSEAEAVEWARTALQIAVNPHDRMQTTFVGTLSAATLDELRVIACTYEGLDAVAGSQRQQELSWKAQAAAAALAAREAALEGREATPA